MRRTAIFLATTALLLAPLTAMAKSRGFDTTIAAPVQMPIKIEVALSEDLAHRADNLPKRLSDRNGATRLNSGFSGNGFYGQKALDQLVEEVMEELTHDLTDRGIVVSDDAVATLRITLEDARNNRPTFEQLSREPSLSFASFGLGGAELSGVLIGADGEELGTLHYRWFDSNFQDVRFIQASGVWTDANRAISRFARRTAKAMS